MGSRTRIAAATCLVASGLLLGGPGTATAIADAGPSANEDSPDRAASSASTGSGSATQHDESADDAESDEHDEDVEEDGYVEEDEDEIADPADDGDEADDPDEGAADDLEEPATDGDADDGTGEEKGEDDEPRPPCCADRDDCDHGGWPWPWPPPDPDEPDEDSSGSGGAYGGGRPAGPPALRPLPGGQAPPEVMPPTEEPPDPDVIDVVPGLGIPAVGAPVSVPLVVPAPVGGGAVAGLPAAPRQVTTAPPPARQPLPGAAGSTVTAPASSYRVGYGEYLRTAGVSQLAALALPGLAGILVLTGAGGLVGYRQAKAGHVVRAGNVARFMD